MSMVNKVDEEMSAEPCQRMYRSIKWICIFSQHTIDLLNYCSLVYWVVTKPLCPFWVYTVHMLTTVVRLDMILSQTKINNEQK